MLIKMVELYNRNELWSVMFIEHAKRQGGHTLTTTCCGAQQHMVETDGAFQTS